MVPERIERCLVVDARCVRAGATGVGRYTAGMLRGLDRLIASGSIAGWRVAALRLAGGHDDWSSGAWKGLENIRPLAAPVDERAHPAADLWLHGCGMDRVMQQARGDVLFSPAFSCPAGPRFYRRIVVIHDTIVWDYPADQPARFRHYLRLSARLSSRWATMVAAPSPAVLARLGELGIGRRSLRRVLSGGVDTEVFHPGGERRPAHPRVVCVGSFLPRKNQDLIARALSVEPLAGRAVDVVLAGPCGAMEERRFQALDPRIRVVRDADDHALATLVREASVLVQPSRAEGFGLPVLEAMASGTSVVASDIPAVRWLSLDGACATLVRGWDPGDWSEAIASALDKPGAAQLATAGRRARQFTIERCAGRLVRAAERAVAVR